MVTLIKSQIVLRNVTIFTIDDRESECFDVGKFVFISF